MKADIAATTIALLIIGVTASAQSVAQRLDAPSVRVETEAEIETQKRLDSANARMLLKKFTQGAEGTEAFYYIAALATGEKKWRELNTDYKSVERWSEAATRVAATLDGPGRTLITGVFARRKMVNAQLGDSQEAARSLFITNNPDIVAEVVRKAIPVLKAERARSELSFFERFIRGEGLTLDEEFAVAPQSLTGTERAEALKVLAEHKIRYLKDAEIRIVWPELADRIDSEDQDDARDATLKEIRTLADNIERTGREHSKAAAARARTDEEAVLAKALCGRGKSSAGRVLACKREDYESARVTLRRNTEKIKGQSPEAWAKRLSAAKDIAELDTSIEEVAQAERLLEVQEDVGEGRAWLGVVTGGLALANPEEARIIQQLGSGAFDIVEGLAMMGAGSLIDPTGISLVLKGIGTLNALEQQPGLTHEEFVRETLEEILKGQDWIGGELDAIELRVAVLQSDVNALTDIMRMSLAEGREDRAAIATHIETLAKRMALAEARLALDLTTLSDAEERRELLAKTAGFKGLFTNWTQRQAYAEIRACAEYGESRCSERALDATEQIRRYLGDLAQRIGATPTRESRDFSSIAPSLARAVLESPPEERVPMAASLLDWLDTEDPARANQEAPSRRHAPFVDPHRTKVLIAQYHSLAKLLPQRTAGGVIIRDANLAEIEAAQAMLATQTRAMRDAIPAAWRTYVRYSNEVDKTLAGSLKASRRRVRSIQTQGEGWGWRKQHDLLTTHATRASGSLFGAGLHAVGRALGATRETPHDARRRTGTYSRKLRGRWVFRLTFPPLSVSASTGREPRLFKQVKDPRTGQSRLVRSYRIEEYFDPGTPNEIRKAIKWYQGPRKFEIWHLLARVNLPVA